MGAGFVVGEGAGGNVEIDQNWCQPKKEKKRQIVRKEQFGMAN